MMMIRDVDSFYWSLLLAITICIFFEFLSFLIYDLHMAIAFRTMIVLILSFPISNKFLTNSTFSCCYSAPLLNRLLTQILIEDLIVFCFVMKGYYIVYYMVMVFFPYLMIYSLSNKESFQLYINKILPSPQAII
jgi:cytochrome c oxidase assembly factor CtaG